MDGRYDAQPGRIPPEPTDLSAAQRDADELDLAAAVRRVAGIVAGARPVADLLHDVAEFAAQALPGVDTAGVALIDVGPAVRTWAATAALVNEIDAVQYCELNEGPCLTCMQTRRPVISGSLGSDPRWPRFGGRVARMGVHSALSLPLIVGDRVIGAINAYARNRDAFGEHAVRVGVQFAGPAAERSRPARSSMSGVADQERCPRRATRVPRWRATWVFGLLRWYTQSQSTAAGLMLTA